MFHAATGLHKPFSLLPLLVLAHVPALPRPLLPFTPPPASQPLPPRSVFPPRSRGVWSHRKESCSQWGCD
ncbi:hypothetical protein E2C01_039898 [Portunus trituberculatus]|uniref:Secreted protein n=1 Tax=Portunus trituberculatus TaxID=210409 RepID=A0A5B7FL01_PORTR|nr:hypothetical protein [Portunus trituberculatus]